MGHIRNIRILSGLIIFVYVTSHLLNLSFGLSSLESMDAWRPVFMAFWQTPIGLVLLYGSLLVHMVLGFEALYHRRTLRMSSFDTIQLVLALMLPPLVALHLLGTRVVSTMVDFEPSYGWIMMIYWKWTPIEGLRQVGVILAAWIHGCMGLYYWMRLKLWWPRASMFLYPAAFIVPVAALLGFVEAGKDVLRLAQDAQWMEKMRASIAPIDKATVSELYRIENVFLITYLTTLLIVLLARWYRQIKIRKIESVNSTKVSYANGPTVATSAGLSLLEISRLNALPHASVCGGRGRCATCRVRIQDGMEALSEPEATELAVLKKVGATPDVRLACQAITLPGLVTVQRLLPGDGEIEGVNLLDYVSGEEREVVVLRMSCLGIAGKLKKSDLASPLVLDEFIDNCVEEITRQEGQVDFIDSNGLMALFLPGKPLEEMAEQAYRISKDILERFNRIKSQLEQQVIVDIDNPIHLDITLHAGKAIAIKNPSSTKPQKVVGEAVNELNRLHEIKRISGIMISDQFAGVLNKPKDGWKLFNFAETATGFSTRSVYIETEILIDEASEVTT